MNKHPRDKALEVVKAGYDQLGEKYASERARFENWREVETFCSHLSDNARVLDAGCGPGIPIAKHLDQSGFRVVGIDISATMVKIAQDNVPGASFLQMNMTNCKFPTDTFDGVISCYAIIHNPRETHAAIFESFHAILKPGGAMLVSVASWAWEEFADYLGVDMFWSHYDPAETKELITATGFDIEFGRDVESGGEKHHWVLAHKR